MSPETLRKKFHVISRRGFVLKPHFNHFKLGLFKAIVFADEDLVGDVNELESRPFIRSISKLEPGNKYMIVYFVPDFALEKFSQRVAGDFPGVYVETVLFNDGSMADFVRYGVTISDICSDESLSTLATMVSEAIRSPEETLIPYIGRRRFDSLDLAIMAYLEREPAARFSDIARALGVAERKVKRHYERHVRSVFEGYRLVSAPYRIREAMVLISMVHDDYDALLSVARVLQRYPLVSSLSITDEGRLYAVLGGPYGCILRFMEYVGRVISIEAASGLRVVSTFTIPYKKYLEYDPRIGWNA